MRPEPVLLNCGTDGVAPPRCLLSPLPQWTLGRLPSGVSVLRANGRPRGDAHRRLFWRTLPGQNDGLSADMCAKRWWTLPGHLLTLPGHLLKSLDQLTPSCRCSQEAWKGPTQATSPRPPPWASVGGSAPRRTRQTLHGGEALQMGGRPGHGLLTLMSRYTTSRECRYSRAETISAP